MEQAKRIRASQIMVIKRSDISNTKALLIQVLAIVLALATGGLFLSVLGHSPLVVYYNMIKGCIGSSMSIQETVKLIVPLLITALGLSIAYRMRFWNIGAEGQICVGAIAASYFALFHSGWPHWVLILVMLAAGIIAGGLWGLIPAYFKSRFGTNETLLTLMLNYVAYYIIQYLREGPWKDPGAMGFPKIARFDANAQMDMVLGVHFGWIIALFLVVATYVYIKYSKQGYEISVVGGSENTARYAGMNVKKIIMRTMFISGAICGLAGMIQASGADKTLTDSVAGGRGFTAITVAWLAQLNPALILVVSVLFGMLTKGSGYIQSMFKIPSAAADVLQGIILFFILGSEFFIQYKLVVKGKGE